MNQSVRERGFDIGLGVLWALISVYWLTRGDDRPLGVAFLMLTIATLVLVVLPEDRSVQWPARAFFMAAILATLVWTLLSRR